MDKKYWKYIGGGAAVILLFILLSWFWSLGAVASEEISTVRVEAIEQPVEWREAGSEDWRELSGAAELEEGDSVRTGEGGEARIRWGDRGVTRLDPETEITIESSDRGEALFSSLLKIKVESGRVWNRVLKVLDIDGGMQVETSDVVATVRGTAFGIAKEAETTDVAVTESVVALPSALLREGQWGSFNASGTVELRQLTDADTWAFENKEKDRAFDEEMRKELMERFRGRVTNNAPLWLIRASESAHLAFLAGDKEQDRAQRYARRHLAIAALNPEERDAAFDALKKRAETAGDHGASLAQEVHVLSLLLSSERYRNRSEVDAFVSRLRELRSDITAGQGLYAGALSIDDRIDDYLFAPATGESRSKDGRELLLELASFAEDLDRRGDLDIPLREQLRKKAEAMGYRLGFDEFAPGDDHTFSDANEIEEEEPPSASTSTEDGSEEEESSVDDAAFTAYQFYANPIKTSVEDPVRLSLYGITPDGVALNITKDADFSIAAPIVGEIQENYYFPSEPGNITLQASITVDGETKTFSTNVQVEGGNEATGEISDVEFEFQGPTDLACSSSVPFKVFARYLDGDVKDVTIMSKKSVSNPNLIHVQDNKVLTYCAPETTSAEVYATYEEGGKRFTAVGVITVTPEPEPARGTPGTPSSPPPPPTTLF